MAISGFLFLIEAKSAIIKPFLQPKFPYGDKGLGCITNNCGLSLLSLAPILIERKGR
jgi:hypothetical protein